MKNIVVHEPKTWEELKKLMRDEGLEDISQPVVEADAEEPCSSIETCETQYDTGDSGCLGCPIRTA